MDACRVEGCARAVSKAGYQFCLDHWKAERAGRVSKCERCQAWHENNGPLCRACAAEGSSDDESPAGYLSSTKIGKHFGISNVKVNLILAELGWIERYVKGWVPTDRGNALGANVREMRNGTPFVVWPDAILRNNALRKSIEEQLGQNADRPTDRRDAPNVDLRGFRTGSRGDRAAGRYADVDVVEVPV